MLKETFGAIGAVALGSSLLAAPPAGAGTQTSGTMGVAAAPGIRLNDLQVEIRVQPKKGSNTVIRVAVEDDDDDAVEGLKVCVDRRTKKGFFVEVSCRLTDEDGETTFSVDRNRTYKVRIPQFKKFKKFTSDAFPGDQKDVIVDST